MLSDSPKSAAYRARVVERRKQKFQSLLEECSAQFNSLKGSGTVSKTMLAHAAGVAPREVDEVMRRYPDFASALHQHNKSVGKGDKTLRAYASPSVTPGDDPLLAQLKATHKSPA